MKTRYRLIGILAFTVLVLGGKSLALSLQRYRFAVNETTSLPNWAFITDLADRKPKRDEIVSFVAPPNPYYPTGYVFAKHVYGVPGDLVERRGREYYVNGRDVGFAKPVSQTGRPTNLGPVGIIPPNHYYVGSTSKDGFDSRYAEIGWIGADRIVGVAEPVL